ncbi:pitrilysin family protein [Olivibacter sp. XZL3]|uniref:M16 family metallopeptidase n=1 Tax=Olivibacter sp. XZL3 TaxID=1735116 RepID=UPI0010659B8E|nr:pitrilysin family protein [Olivibacter sp. XZL3]
MDHQLIHLSNGIRVLLKPADTVVSHACILINAGTRDELPHQYGMAHFIEHLLFKRTERRNTNQILNRLELVGADLNAYTTKEYTCIHASFLKEHLTRVLDLFEDIIFHSVYPEAEMEKERGVILDEIASYQDSPEDAIADDFEDMLFEKHALGHNILGTNESLNAIKREDIFEFLNENYCTDQIVLAITGNYEWAKIKTLAEGILDKIPANLSKRKRSMPVDYRPSRKKTEKPIVQTHVSLGNVAYSLHDDRKTGLMVLNNLLGGMGMSSRLNLQIREKYGIAYTIESNYTPYTDTGLFSIYYGTDEDKAHKALKLVNRELKKLRDTKLGVLQLYQAKQKFIGQIALGEENRMGVLISMAKNLLDYGKINTLEEVVEKINKVTAEELLAIANEIFDETQISELAFVPEQE